MRFLGAICSAILMLTLSCEANASDLTFSVAGMNQARITFENSCLGGKVESCPLAANMYYYGAGIAADGLKARMLYEKGCNGGDAESCGALSYMYRKGQGVTTDVAKASAYLEQAFTLSDAACKSASDGGCFDLRKFYADGARDAVRREAACNEGKIEECLGLAYSYNDGERVLFDSEKYLFFFKKWLSLKAVQREEYDRDCASGSSAACSLLAGAFKSGDAVGIDLIKSRAYLEKERAIYDRGCRAGDFWKCINLAELYERDINDRATSEEILRRSCNSGAKKSCERLQDSIQRRINPNISHKYADVDPYIPIPVSAMGSLGSFSKYKQYFYSYAFLYCGVITDLEDGKWDFKYRIIDGMKATSKGKMDSYWLVAGCEPRYIALTWSPLIHIIAENPTDRMQFLVMLKSIYVKSGHPEVFQQIINAKNSSGMTTLDYIEYMYENSKFIKLEEDGVNKFVSYLCENGAIYSKYNLKCPRGTIILKAN